MAFQISQTLAVPSSVSAGAATDVSGLTSCTVFITGITTATVQIQVSGDGTNWNNEQAALTANGNVFINKPVKQIRANVTAYTSGTLAGLILGLA